MKLANNLIIVKFSNLDEITLKDIALKISPNIK